MITVYLNKPDFEYDIHSLIKAFYVEEDVKVSADKEVIFRLEQENEILFRMEISYYSGITIKIFHILSKNIETETEERISETQRSSKYHGGEFSMVMQEHTEVDLSDRKAAKNKLKQRLYRILSGRTGRILPWGTLTGIRPVKIPMSMLESGKSEDEVRTYMADTYFTERTKIDLSIEIANREIHLLKQLDYEDGYGLYIGIPFCPSICAYCSFSSSPIGMWEDRVGNYLDALEREIDFTAKTFIHKKLNIIYVGGGTPTTLSPPQLERLLAKIEDRFDLSALIEYTVEAGRPDSITREKLEVLKRHGVSRISINPQTMKQKTLDIIGRRHTVRQTIDSFYLAREMGFDNINMDLIVGLPEEDISDVKNTMEQIKSLEPDSVTVHSLAIKRAARLNIFSDDYRGMQMINTPEMIGLTAQYAGKMGLLPYYLYRQKNMAGNFENVGYAKPEKAGIYNILIMEEKQTIVACGAGSISKRVYPDGRIERCENVKDVASYIERIDEMIERKRKLLEG